MDEYSDHCYTRNGPCACNLAIPGQVPKDKPFLAEHFQFLRFLNKLSTHEMFDGFKIDQPYPIPEEELTSNEFE